MANTLHDAAPGPGWVAGLLAATQGLTHDLTATFRGFRRDAGWTTAVVAMLAIALGLNTALFGIVDAVLLKPLPFEAPERLVRVRAAWSRNADIDLLLPGGMRARVEALDAFDAVEAAGTTRVGYETSEGVESVSAGLASDGLFAMLGITPAIGRVFEAGEPPKAVLLTHGFWLERFGGDPRVLGQSLRLDGAAHAIVGVLPPGFEAPFPRFTAREPAIWLSPDPAAVAAWESESANYGALYYAAQLAPGATLAAAQAQMDRVTAAVRAAEPDYEQYEVFFRVDPLQARLTRAARPTLLVLSGAVAVVLLVACANVLNLLLVRARARTHELALRRALGASPARLARQLIVEGAVLGVLGSAAGLVLAFWGTPSMAALAPAGVPGLADVALGPRTVAFAAVLVVVTTVLGALAPALAASRRAAGVHGSRGTRIAGGRGIERTHFSLASLQIALALTLVVAAALLAATFARLQRADPGFDTTNLVTFTVSAPAERYQNGESAGRLIEAVEARVRALPGVQAAGAGWPLPLSSANWFSPYAVDRDPDDRSRNAAYHIVTPGFFDALGLRAREGRTFRPEDPPPTAVISESLARAAWPGERAVGRRLWLHPWGEKDVPFEVVGVVHDVIDRTPRLGREPALYVPARGWLWAGQPFNIVLRSDQPLDALAPAIRAAVREVDPASPVADMSAYRQLLDRHTEPARFSLALVGTFAATAVVLAIVGLYGVIAYRVARRRHEFGIRLALGADAGGLIRIVLSDWLRMVAVGVVAGLTAAVLLSRFLAAQLYGVSATDAATYALATTVVALVALAAAWLPARRAAGIEPASLLRAE